MKKALILMTTLLLLLSVITLLSCGKHKHREWIVSGREATCQDAGWTEEIRCRDCREVLVESKPIDPLSHTEEIIPAKEPTTCNREDGLTEGKICSVCGEWLVHQKCISLPHTEEIIPAIESTCNAYGYTEGIKCSVCNETIVWPTLIYEYGDHREVIDEAIAANCTETGLTEGKHCDVCDTVLVKQEVIPALGHSYDEWVVDKRPSTLEEGLRHSECSACGETTYKNYNFSKGLSFELNDDGQSYYVYGIGTCTDNEIIIPNYHNNLPVTAIGASAFKDCKNITYVEIPYTITSILSGAFMGCRSITYMFIPNSVTYMSANIFYDCISLERIEFDSKIQLTTIGQRSFYNCGSLTSIVIPDTVTSIPYETFYGCNSLTSVVIGKSVTDIDVDAFIGCYSLIEVCNKSDLGITAGSEENGLIGYYAKTIINDESLSSLKRMDDYIFYDDGDDIYLVQYLGKDSTIILPEYDGGKEYGIWNGAFFFKNEITNITIPDFVTSIGDKAFEYCSLTSIVFDRNSKLNSIGAEAFCATDITSIEIPDSVVSIGDCAFGYTDLTEIVIPDSVMYMGSAVFEFSSDITIYCEAESKPYGWSSTWDNHDKHHDNKFTVVWGYTGE